MIPHAPHKAPWTSGSNLPLVSTPYPGVMTEEGALALCVFALWSPLLLHRDMAAVDPALTRNTLLQFHGSVIWIKWNSVSFGVVCWVATVQLPQGPIFTALQSPHQILFVWRAPHRISAPAEKKIRNGRWGIPSPWQAESVEASSQPHCNRQRLELLS